MKPSALNHLLDIMRQLRDPKTGCPWDQQQTCQSIAPYTLEEIYEILDAIARGDWMDLKDELGDLLFHIVFYCQMASEQGQFCFDDVAEGVCEKLIRRHPHVFDALETPDMAELSARWEAMKTQERVAKGKGTSILDDVSAHQPAMMQAMKIQKRCARVGFDWTTLAPVVAKVHEEIDEVMAEALMADVDQARIDDEMGDLLFAVINLSRHLGTDPEMALRQANQKFERRFRQVEQNVIESGQTLQAASLEEMEAHWQLVKQQEKML